jgi:hypothetical protein
VRVVVVVTLSVAIWTLVLLAFLYPQLRAVLLRLTRLILARRRRLLTFVAVLFAVPLLLVAS